MSLTPPSVDAVKGMMPLQSISSDGSDLVSSPDFSLTEMDLSKVSIAEDLEQSLDISSATQGNRMVTAVEVGRDNPGNFDRNIYLSLSTPLLKSLHWLPVRYRVFFFKICTLSSHLPIQDVIASGILLHSLLTPARQSRHHKYLC